MPSYRNKTLNMSRAKSFCINRLISRRSINLQCLKKTIPFCLFCILTTKHNGIQKYYFHCYFLKQHLRINAYKYRLYPTMKHQNQYLRFSIQTFIQQERFSLIRPILLNKGVQIYPLLPFSKNKNHDWCLYTRFGPKVSRFWNK